jgi:DNA-binding NtrC family response regulator
MNSAHRESAPRSSLDGESERILHGERIFLVEDDPEIQMNVREILECDGYQVDVAGSLGDLQSRTDWAEFVVILLDRILRDGTTDDILPHIRQMAPQAAVFIVTGYKDVDSAIAAIHHGATDYLIKPIDPGLLRTRLRRVVENRRFQERMGRLPVVEGQAGHDEWERCGCEVATTVRDMKLVE